jgi:hypothetical protein
VRYQGRLWYIRLCDLVQNHAQLLSVIRKVIHKGDAQPHGAYRLQITNDVASALCLQSFPLLCSRQWHLYAATLVVFVTVPRIGWSWL